MTNRLSDERLRHLIRSNDNTTARTKEVMPEVSVVSTDHAMACRELLAARQQLATQRTQLEAVEKLIPKWRGQVKFARQFSGPIGEEAASQIEQSADELERALRPPQDPATQEDAE